MNNLFDLSANFIDIDLTLLQSASLEKLFYLKQNTTWAVSFLEVYNILLRNRSYANWRTRSYDYETAILCRRLKLAQKEVVTQIIQACEVEISENYKINIRWFLCYLVSLFGKWPQIFPITSGFFIKSLSIFLLKSFLKEIFIEQFYSCLSKKRFL